MTYERSLRHTWLGSSLGQSLEVGKHVRWKSVATLPNLYQLVDFVLLSMIRILKAHRVKHGLKIRSIPYDLQAQIE